MERALMEGYGGKGVFFVWAGGNGAMLGDDANLAATKITMASSPCVR